METGGYWNYLILTASNHLQAEAYQMQLRWRVQAGCLSRVRETLVVADLDGKRIGSGGSTVHCLATVLERERARARVRASNPAEIFRHLRILIIHAGGDSRRLPAYAPCGKIFVPLPGETSSAIPTTLFDRLVPPFLNLPPGLPGAGQIVVAAGDALNFFDHGAIRFDYPGITAIGAYASPEEAARHGVFCLDPQGGVRLFLQKPSIQKQHELGAITSSGQTPLDIGLMSFDAPAAAALLEAFDSGVWPLVLELGADLYREICCALGAETTFQQYLGSARASGSAWPESQLARLYAQLRAVPFQARMAPRCRFLHFGSTRQLISSGIELLALDQGSAPEATAILVNNRIESGGAVSGSESWVEGCILRAPLTLTGRNVVVGVDIDEPLSLPRGGCLEVVPGRSRSGAPGCFIRCYGVNDTFKDPAAKGGTFCGVPLMDWLAAVSLSPEDVWEESLPASERSLWNARVFPFETSVDAYRRWLWMLEPAAAGAEHKARFRQAERYSAEQIAWLADQTYFHQRRASIRAWNLRPLR
jgi:fucokinase